jgi:integrase
MRKPFFRKQTQSWYVKDEAGRFVFLAKSKSEAHEIWRSMLQSAAIVPDRIATLTLCDEFIDEHTSLITPARYDDAVRVLSSFVAHFGDGSPAIGVTPNKVLEWLRAPKPRQPRKPRKDKHGRELPDDRPPFTWSTTRQRDAAAWILRVYRWGVATARLSRNPLDGMPMPNPNHREGVIDPETHGRLVRAAMESKQSRSFAVYLIASHCGARPQQIREITAQDCSPDFAFATFQRHKTRHKTGKPLVVYFGPCMQSLLRILAYQRPTGRLFVNDSGHPWTKNAAGLRFRRLRERLALPSTIVLYLYRHTYATDSLRSGMSESMTAALLGHKSSDMVRRIYGHLSLHDQEMIDAAAMAAKKRLAKD